MKLKKCEYCGTEFDAALSQCPLCGKAVQPGAAEPQPVMPAAYKPAGGRGGKFSKKKGGHFAADPKKEKEAKSAENPYKIPKWMMVTICVILGLAVLMGAAFALYQLSWFPKFLSPKEPVSMQEPAQQPAQEAASEPSQPAVPTEQQYMNEEDYQPEEADEPFFSRVPLPCAVKPHCGESFGLTASQRYRICRTKDELRAAFHHFKALTNEDPIVQEYLPGAAYGCSVLAKDGAVYRSLCHRRVREYPVSGGPSSCCESVSRSDLLAFSEALVQETGFTGPAMFEFKCAADGSPRLLEVNPRVWGTFPLTRAAKTDFAYSWFCLAANLPLPEEVPAQHVKMAYYPADFAAGLGYLKAGQPGRFFAAAADFLSPCVKNGIADPKDPAPAQVYFRNLFHRGGHK